MERLDKKEQEGNDLAEGPHSRTEWNDLKKFGTCLALGTVQFVTLVVVWTKNGVVFLPSLLSD